jgi:hypothetical protein
MTGENLSATDKNKVDKAVVGADELQEDVGQAIGSTGMAMLCFTMSKRRL